MGKPTIMLRIWGIADQLIFIDRKDKELSNDVILAAMPLFLS